MLYSLGMPQWPDFFMRLRNASFMGLNPISRSIFSTALADGRFAKRRFLAMAGSGTVRVPFCKPFFSVVSMILFEVPNTVCHCVVKFQIGQPIFLGYPIGRRNDISVGGSVSCIVSRNVVFPILSYEHQADDK